MTTSQFPAAVDDLIGPLGPSAVAQYPRSLVVPVADAVEATQQYLLDVVDDLPGFGWQDLRVPLSLARIGNPGDEPSFNVFRAPVRLWEFSAAAMQELFFTVQLPHGFDTDSDLKAHIHFTTTNTAATGTIRWGLDYTVANVGDDFGAPVTLTITDYTIDHDAQYEHMLHPLGTIDAAALRDSAQLICRIYRDAANDSFVGTAFGIEVDFHYRTRAFGSVSEYPTP